MNTLMPHVGLLDLLCSGISESDGDVSVYNRAVSLFTEFTSDDIEDCIAFAVINKVSIWDFYPDTDREEWHDQMNDLWVSFICREAASQ